MKMPEIANSQNERRRQVLVSSGIQWAIVRESVWNWLLYFTAVAFLIGLLQLLRADPTKPLLEHLQTIGELVLTMFLVFAVLLPKFICDWFRLSHRFLGPVERVRRALRELADGKAYADIHFREGDFWDKLADELNAAVRSLKESRDKPGADARDEETPPQPEVTPRCEFRGTSPIETIRQSP